MHWLTPITHCEGRERKASLFIWVQLRRCSNCATHQLSIAHRHSGVGGSASHVFFCSSGLRPLLASRDEAYGVDHTDAILRLPDVEIRLQDRVSCHFRNCRVFEEGR
jgi:hypothetical protein